MTQTNSANNDCSNKTFPWPLSIAGKDLATSDTIRKNLAYGGQIAMPFGPTFWAKGFGMLVDKFGVSWMVNCE